MYTIRDKNPSKSEVIVARMKKQMSTQNQPKLNAIFVIYFFYLNHVFLVILGELVGCVFLVVHLGHERVAQNTARVTQAMEDVLYIQL